MPFSTLIEKLRNAITGSRSRRARAKAAGPRRSKFFRPWMEVLEARTVPSTVTWTGNGGDFNWGNSANWNINAVPGVGVEVGDDVQIGSTAASVTIGSASNISINSLTSQAAIVVSGGSLALAAPSTVDDLQVDAGTLLANQNLTVNGSLTWSGGTITGGGTVTVAVGGTLTIDGATNYLVGETLTNLGTATWTNGNIEMDDAAVFNNAGTLTLPFDSSGYAYDNQQGAASTVNNSGTLIDAAGGGSLNGIGNIYSEGGSGVVFNNSNSVQLQSGRLDLVGSGTSIGSFSVAAGGDLAVVGQTLTSSSTVMGAGQVEWYNSTVGGYYNISGTTNVEPGLVDFTGTVSSVGQTLNVSGTADFHGNALSLTTLNVSGTLADSASVAVSGAMNWSGTLTGGGPVTVAVAGTLTIDGATNYLVGETLTNLGTATWTNGNIEMDDAAVFNNAGTLTLPFDSSGYAYDNQQGAASTVNNSGTLIDAAGGGSLNGIGNIYSEGGSGVVFNNSNSVQLQSGRLDLVGSGTSIGSFSVAAGGDLAVVGQTLTSSSTVMGAGQVEWYNSTVGGYYNISGTTNVEPGLVDFTGTVSSVGQTLNVSGTADFHGNALSLTTLNVSGTLADSASVAVSGAMNWSGTLTGGGPVTVAVGGTLTIDGATNYLVGETLTNLGTATWTNGNIEMDDAAVFNNAGTLTLPFDSSGYAYDNQQGAASTVNNSGTLIDAAGGGSLNGIGNIYSEGGSGVVFNNSNSVQLQSGRLDLVGSGTSIGSFSVAAGGDLAVVGQTLTSSSTVMGAGQVEWYNSTVGGYYNISGTTNVEPGLVDFTGTVSSVGQTLNVSGTADFHGNALSLTTLNVSGTLADSAGLAVSGTLDLTGELTGGGTVTVAVGGTLTIYGATNYLVGETLTNLGTATWTNGNIEMDDAAVFNNAGTLTLPFDSSGYAYDNQQGAASTVNNSGTLIDAAGGGSLNGIGNIYSEGGSGVVFNNSNSVQLQSGRLDLVGSGTSIGSFSVAAGGDLAVVGQTLTSSSTVMGAGQVEWYNSTVGGYYNISGTTNVEPGLVDFTGTVSSVGQTLNVSGTADIQGQLIEQMSGAAPGQYGQITGTGTVSLSSALQVELVGGFAPMLGDFFTIISASAVSGQFSGLPEGGTLSDQLGDVYQISYGGGYAVTLTAIHVINSPPTASLSGPSAGGLYQPLTFTLGASDTSPIDQAGDFTYAVNWGDGTSDTVVGPSSATDTHAYTNAGPYTVTLTATDEDGLVSQPVTASVTVSAMPQLQNGILAVPGTANNATITLTPTLPTGAAAYSMNVRYTNGTTTTNYGPYAVSNIEVYGGPGTDAVTLGGTGNNDAFTVGNGSVGELAAQNTTEATPFTVDQNAITSLTLKGAGGSNSLTGPNQANTWDVTAANAGTLDGAIAFTGIQNLIGGPQTNDFVFTDAAKVAGNLDGGGGGTLDLSQYTTNVTGNLATNKWTGVGGTATNLVAAIAGSGSNTLTGADTTNTWSLAGTNSGSINGTLAFAGFQNLTGGSTNDTFVFLPGGSIAGNLKGGAPVNTLDYSGYGSAVTIDLQAKTAPGIGGTWANIQSFNGTDTTDTLKGPNAASTWSITGRDAGTVGAYSFTGFPNLTGGTGNNTFNFAAGASMTGVVTGGGGANTLDYSAYGSPVTVNLQTTNTTGIGAWANIQTIKGTDTTDTLIATNAAANTWALKGNNAGTVDGVSFTGFANLTGGSGNNTFQFAAGATVSGVINGGGGSNTLDYSAYTGGVTVNLGNLTTDLANDSATGIDGGAANGISNISTVIIGAGNNYLTAVGASGNVAFTATGNGNNIVVGGSGTNTLTASGSGNNILIGDQGTATLNGGSGYNLLIGGTTNYDDLHADLEAIMLIWKTVSSAAAYNTAIKKLTAASYAYALTAATVHSNATDTLNAGTQLLDWYFAAAVSEISGKKAGETFTPC